MTIKIEQISAAIKDACKFQQDNLNDLVTSLNPSKELININFRLRDCKKKLRTIQFRVNKLFIEVIDIQDELQTIRQCKRK